MSAAGQTCRSTSREVRAEMSQILPIKETRAAYPLRRLSRATAAFTDWEGTAFDPDDFDTSVPLYLADH